MIDGIVGSAFDSTHGEAKAYADEVVERQVRRVEAYGKVKPMLDAFKLRKAAQQAVYEALGLPELLDTTLDVNDESREASAIRDAISTSIIGDK